MRRLFPAVLALTWALRAQGPTVDPRGIYVYSEHLAQDAQMLTQALTVNGVDGLTLLLGWAEIEPKQGSYTWSLLDQWMTSASSSGKKVALAVRAGQDTPCWLFQAPACGGSSNSYAGATALAFSASAREGNGQSGCNPETIAAPWDPIFLSQWDAMLAAVAAHLKTAGTYAALTSVRLSGINRTTAELRLPAEILTSPCVINSVATWLKASPPFSSGLLLSAWDKLTTSYLNNFPDKYFGVEIIPTASGTLNTDYPFPAIDPNGCPYQPPWPTDKSDPNYLPVACLDSAPTPDQNAPLLALAAQKFAGRLSVSYQNLDLRSPANPYVPYAAQTWGTTAGYQTNDYFNLQNAACSGSDINPGPCTSATYLQLLELGIYPLGRSNTLLAQYIEVLPPDAVSFPDAILKAHQELVSTPSLTPGTLANGATYLAGGLVPGSWAQVKGTGISSVTRIWGNSDFANLGSALPVNLSGVEVKVNGLPAAVYYMSPTQVSFQVPTGISGTASVQVFNGSAASNVVTASAATNAPGIFPIIVNGTNYAAAVFLDGKIAGDPSAGSAFRNAKPGEVVQLYATGLVPSTAGVLAVPQTVSGVSVTVGTVTVPADFAGLVAVGEFQINFKVPQQFSSQPAGSYPIAIQINGVTSPAQVVLPIHP